MLAVRMALALAWTVVAIGVGGVHGQASLSAFQFDVGSVTDECDCLKIVITSLYRAGETLDNIKAYASACIDQHQQGVEAMPVLARPTGVSTAADWLHKRTNRKCVRMAGPCRHLPHDGCAPAYCDMDYITLPICTGTHAWRFVHAQVST